MTDKKKWFCAAPFKAAFVHPREQNTFVPCCKVTLANFAPHTTFENYWNHPTLKYIKDEFKAGRITNICDVCVVAEKAGVTSMRHQQNGFFNLHEYDESRCTDQLEALSISSSNVCNLECRHCSSVHSTKLRKEDAHIVDLKLLEPARSVTSRFVINLDEALLNQLRGIRGMSISGGDPFLMPNELHETILDTINFDIIDLMYITNGTVWPSKNIIEKIVQVKDLHLRLSADGFGTAYEYMRYPGKWDTFVRTFHKWDKLLEEHGHPRPAIKLAISIYNVLFVKDLLDWTDSQGVELEVTYVNNPDYLSIHCFPAAQKEAISRILSSYENPVLDDVVNFMMMKDDYNLFETGKRMINAKDAYRNQSFSSLFPEENAVLHLDTTN